MKQKQTFRRKRLEAISQVGTWMNADTRMETSPHHRKFPSFPGANVMSLETAELLEADLKRCSVSRIGEEMHISLERSPNTRTLSSWDVLPFEGRSVPVSHMHMTWDKILHQQQSPKTKKTLSPRHIRNIHTHANRKHNPFHPQLSPKPLYQSPWPQETAGLRLVALAPNL